MPDRLVAGANIHVFAHNIAVEKNSEPCGWASAYCS
jgi:hypothetical protein